MKRTSSIRSLLGVTQHDMARLLGVSRSLWSLYELGQRDLPLPAQQLLSEMLVYVQAADTKRPSAIQNQAVQEQLERLLRENEYQQLRLAREMAAAIKKCEAVQRAVKLTEFLENRAAGETAKAARLLKIKSSQTIEKQAFAVVVALEMRQESLILVNLMMKSKLRKLRPDGTDDENFLNNH